MSDFKPITDPIDIPENGFIGVPPPEPKWYEIINADIDWKTYLQEMIVNAAIILE